MPYWLSIENALSINDESKVAFYNQQNVELQPRIRQREHVIRINIINYNSLDKPTNSIMHNNNTVKCIRGSCVMKENIFYVVLALCRERPKPGRRLLIETCLGTAPPSTS